MSKLLINEPPLLILPSLALAIGLNEAIILQQIHYWLDPRINQNFYDSRFWVYNTYEQWQKQFPFFSEITIKRSIISLENKGLVISATLSKDKFNKTKWYSIDYDSLKSFETKEADRSDQYDTIDRSKRSTQPIKMIRSYKETETTTKITTNNSLSKSLTIKETNVIKEYEREKEMINIWDQEIREGEKASVQSKTRLVALKKVIEEYFEGNLDNWKSYCLNIRKSNFLMGGGVNNWKADLTWAIRQENLIRVLEGYYHHKEGKSVENSPNEIILEEIDNISKDPTWNIVKEKLKINKGEATYKSWFRKLAFKGYDKETILLGAPSKFIKDWILSNFKDDIIRLFKETDMNIKDIEIFVENEEVALV